MDFFKRKASPEKVVRRALEAFEILLGEPEEKAREKVAWARSTGGCGSFWSARPPCAAPLSLAGGS